MAKGGYNSRRFKPPAQKKTKSKIAKSGSRSRPKAPSSGTSRGQMSHEKRMTGGGSGV